MLCKKHGLPPSRLASLRSPREENNCVQEECALPRLLKKEVVVEEEKVDMEETKEKQVVKVWELRLAAQPILRREAS